MNRQARVALLTAAMAAGVAPAFGQAPAAPTGGGPVYVMKTAGQPERRVQVLKSETQPDGSILTDVKDLGTGTVYTLTNPAFLGKAAPATPSMTPVPAAVASAPTQMPAPGTPRPLFGQFPNQRMANAATSTAPVQERLVPVEQATANGLPTARSRKTDPLLAGLATRMPNEPPNVMAKVFGDPMKNQPPPRVGVLPAPTPTDAAALAPRPKASSGVTVVLPTTGPAVPTPKPEAALAPKPALPVPAPAVAAVPPPKPADAAIAIPAIDASAKPSAATGLFDSQAAPAGVVLPRIAEPAAVPAVPSLAVPAIAEPSVAIPAPPSEPVAVAIPAPAASSDLPRDVKQMIDDVKTHKRPTFRMENATALAESAYAKHPAAIEALLHAATNDKAGVVRGHCIARLADLGYSDPTYLKLLDAWANDLEPAVQRAAVDAKAKLGR